MRRAFGDGGATLVLIGDPKQAIYAFRGADVYAYLEAANGGRHARDARRQLAQRPGADRRLRRAASAAPSSATRASSTAGSARPTPTRRRACTARRSRAPLRIRVVHRDEPSIELTRGGFASNASRARAHRQGPRRRPRRRCSSSDAEIEIRADDGDAAAAASASGPATSPCSCAPTATPRSIRDALDEAGIPAVINGAGSVFGTAPARDWLRLLEALERPTSPRARALGRAHAVPRLDRRAGRGGRRGRLGGASTAACTTGRACCACKGVASLTETITLVEGLPERVLRDGRRRARADRPAPRRPAPARRGDDRADGHRPR